MPRAANRRLSVASGGLAGFALRFKVARDAFLLPDGTQGYAGRKPRLSFVLLLLRIEWLLRRTCKYFRWERVGNGGEARASQAGPLGRASLLGVSLMGRPADAPSQLTCAHGPFPCSSRNLCPVPRSPRSPRSGNSEPTSPTHAPHHLMGNAVRFGLKRRAS